MKKFFVFFAVIAAASAADLNLNEMCSGLLFESLAHPTDSNLFIGCVQGKGTLLGCSGQDEIFDPFLVACVKDDIPTNPDHDALCENITFGWFPHETDCELYIVCEFSRPHVRQCPEDSIFNRYLPGCVPGDAETCTFEHHTTPAPPTTTTTPEPTTTQTTTTAEPCLVTCPVGEILDVLNCQCYCPIRQCPVGEVLEGCQCVPEPTTIATTTPEPTTTETTTTVEPCLITCRIGEVLDIANCFCYCPIRECSSGYVLEGCQCVPEPTTTPTTTPEPTTTTTTTTAEPCLVTCAIGENLDYDNCRCYCPITECASGYVLEGCQCVPVPTNPPPTTTLRTTTPGGGNVNINFNCPISGDGNVPHATNCSRYFECIQMVRFPRTCDAGLIFDVITSRCNDPEVSLCAANIRCL